MINLEDSYVSKEVDISADIGDDDPDEDKDKEHASDEDGDEVDAPGPVMTFW